MFAEINPRFLKNSELKVKKLLFAPFLLSFQRAGEMKSNLLCDVSRTRSYAWARKTTLIRKAKWIHGLWIFSFSSDFFDIMREFALACGSTVCSHTRAPTTRWHTVNKTTLFPTCTRFAFETFAVSFCVTSEWPFPNRSPGYHCHTWDQDSH